jgi:hypothetical protein
VDTDATADRARQRVKLAQARLAELRIRMAQMSNGGRHISSHEQVGRATRLAEDSRKHARAAYEHALQTHLAAAQMHTSAARLHDDMADAGVGDIGRHRELAGHHRTQAAKQEEHAEQCRREKAARGF